MPILTKHLSALFDERAKVSTKLGIIHMGGQSVKKGAGLAVEEDLEKSQVTGKICVRYSPFAQQVGDTQSSQQEDSASHTSERRPSSRSREVQ